MHKFWISKRDRATASFFLFWKVEEIEKYEKPGTRKNEVKNKDKERKKQFYFIFKKMKYEK